MAAARVGGAFWAPALSPPVVGRARRASIESAADWDDAARLPDTPFDPWSALDGCTEWLGAADDPLTALAIAAGVPTTDPASGARRSDADEHALLEGALFGQRWLDPLTGEPCEAEQLVERLAGWRALIDANATIHAAAGMAWWKRDAIGRLIWRGGEPLRHLPGDQAADAIAARPGGVVIWPSRVPIDVLDRARAGELSPVWAEDGFLRSSGLGSDCHPPLSIALDRQRPHFDPAGPSDLEDLLAHGRFDPDLTARAARLRRSIVAGRLGKYGGAATRPAPAERAGPDRPGATRVVLVTGQVSDDLSMRFGAPDIDGNLALLARARRWEDDHATGPVRLLFKAHPDVVRGHREGAVATSRVLAYADEIVDEPTTDLFDRIDAVHVATSLAGFEALLRGRQVHCHGSPFYAGWGLTTDHGPPLPRRGRRLTLDELVAGALILYPRYLDPVTGLPCPVELFVERMIDRSPAPNWLSRLRVIQGRLRRLVGGRLDRRC